MTRVSWILAPVALLLVSHAGPGMAQQHGSLPAPHAVNLALDAGGTNLGPAAAMLLSYRSGQHEVAARGLATARISAFGDGAEELLDLGLMYGWHPLESPSTLALRVGVGSVWYSLNPEGPAPNTDYGATLGVPFEIAVSGSLGSMVGLGVSLVGNANKRQSYLGALVSLSFGRR